MIDAWSSFMLMVLSLVGAPADVQFAAVAVVVIAVALIALVVAHHATSPLVTGATVFARHGAGRAPTTAQSDPDAPGHRRPRAPGYAAFAA